VTAADADAIRFARPSPFGVLWRFARPHTIVGTALSVIGLYAIAASELPGPAPGLADLWWTLVAALAVNVFIVGLNQLEDVEIDRVNKPFLPLAAGELSPARGRAIVAIAGLVPVVLALTQGPVELAGVVVALLVGVAYSSPPLRLKRFPAVAAMSISGVRAVVVNLVVFLHFSGDEVVAPVWALTLFVLPFAFAIAVLKDVPDAEGDRRFEIATFTLRLGAPRAVGIAMGALSAAYLAMAVAGPFALDGADPGVLSATHVAALALLWHWRGQADLGDREAYTRFYLRVWKLFFLEYVIVPLACAA
jgi:homogentisate phytyltransferase/homogentisate geranylgeranyltransferase